MGGRGSGNHYHWWREGKKTVVEDCQALDANRWTRDGVLRAGAQVAGSCHWTYRDGRECSIGYIMRAPPGAQPVLRLSYSWTHPGTGEKEPIEYVVRLTTTRPRFGGLRWWFVCPLLVNGQGCYRRVGRLYLPPGCRYFGCRHCHALTYTSCQQHDKRVDFLRRNPEVLERLAADLEGASVAQLGLLLKALKV
jgi:hypothetical protein